jgi:hypothetical protein
MKAPLWAQNTIWLELVMYQPELIFAIPQGESLFTEQSADTRYRWLYGPIPGLVPLDSELACPNSKYVTRAAQGVAAGILLASSDQKRTFRDNDVGEDFHA